MMRWKLGVAVASAAALLATWIVWGRVGAAPEEQCATPVALSEPVSSPDTVPSDESQAREYLRGLARRDGLPPLIWYGLGRPRLLQTMLALGVNPNVCWGGMTPLALSAYSGANRQVAQLLDGGADIDTPRGAEGGTALRSAIERGRYDTARYLLERGADPRRDRDTLPLLTALALYPETLNSDRHRQKLELARTLLTRGAGANARASDTGTGPLAFAALQGDAELVALLLAHGADPAARGKRGETPLSLARSKGRAAVVAQLEAAQRQQRSASAPR